jgi:hypothetical protein
LYWMSFFDVLFLITSFVSFDHCIECPSLIYCFLLSLWYLLTQRRTYNTMVKRYQRGNKKQYIKEGHSIQWSKDTKEVIRNSRSKKDIQYSIFWPLYCMSFFDILFLITSFVSFDHFIVCPSLIYCFLLPLWYLLTYFKEGHSIQWSKDTKEVIRNSISKKDIQYNGQKIQKR